MGDFASMMLARLEQVDPRSVWASEAESSTPWLAFDENIALVGDAIGMELEVEATERSVGPFRADILCKDTGTGHWVLVENQLARTDHTHLGQLITYASGLKAVTIVWVADRFTEEHRAALDWLNDITDDRFNFFGLELEVWRISNSAAAPKFNVVSKPNDWSKRIGSAASRIDSDELTETKALQLEYWTELRERLLEQSRVVKPQKPLAQHWTNFALGRSYFGMFASVNTQQSWIAVGMSCLGPSAKHNFGQLHAQRVEIEREVGSVLSWEELPDKKESKVQVRLDGDPTDRSAWSEQHEWMISMLERFHTAFSPRVKALRRG